MPTNNQTTDIVTYVADYDVLRTELKNICQEHHHHSDCVAEDMPDEETGECKQSLIIGQGLHVYKDDSSLCLCRVTDEQIHFIDSLTSLEIIGYDRGGNEFEFVEGGEAKYESVYSTAPVTVPADPEMGTEETVYTPPKKFAVFA